MLNSISNFFTFSKSNDLRKVFSTKNCFTEPRTVTFEMTTNRTGKVGDEILSTPSFLDEIINMLIKIINNKTPTDVIPLAKHVQFKHKGPLKCGKDFTIEAKPNEIEKNSVSFNVKGVSYDNRVIGEGEILLELVKNE